MKSFATREVLSVIETLQSGFVMLRWSRRRRNGSCFRDGTFVSHFTTVFEVDLKLLSHSYRHVTAVDDERAFREAKPFFVVGGFAFLMVIKVETVSSA